MRRRGPPTADSVRRGAERTYSHFASTNVLARIGIAKPDYAYAYGITPKGKALFLGPIADDEAEAIASALKDGEVFYLGTRDLKKATQEIKAELVRRGKPPDEALARMSHRKELIEE